MDNQAMKKQALGLLGTLAFIFVSILTAKLLNFDAQSLILPLTVACLSYKSKRVDVFTINIATNFSLNATKTSTTEPQKSNQWFLKINNDQEDKWSYFGPDKDFKVIYSAPPGKKPFFTITRRSSADENAPYAFRQIINVPSDNLADPVAFDM